MTAFDRTRKCLPGDRSVDDFWRDTGELLSLFLSDQRYAARPGFELMGMIIPALGLGQYAMARVPDEIPGLEIRIPAPKAALLWASVTAEVDQRLRTAVTIPILKPHEWTGGPHHWLIHTPGDMKLHGDLIYRLRTERLAGQRLSALLIGPDGGVKIHDFRP
jgi:hemolysin-activating ACP:hemolysin acyltransferase